MANRTERIDRWIPILWDEAWYLSRYPDIAAAVTEGKIANPLFHYLQTGLIEGRHPSAIAEKVRGGIVSVSQDPVQLGNSSVALDWPVKGETGKTFALRLTNGFFHKYLSGGVVLDIGFRGANADAVPVFPHATGVDLDYPGYDGHRLPFADGTVDAVFSSHVLEHLSDPTITIRDWFRVLKTGGFIVCIVPHQFLYERKGAPPSLWNKEHLRFYTPGSLLREFEEALRPNTYRLRHMADNDLGYAYDIAPTQHAYGCYEIELVLEKIAPPSWDLL